MARMKNEFMPGSSEDADLSPVFDDADPNDPFSNLIGIEFDRLADAPKSKTLATFVKVERSTPNNVKTSHKMAKMSKKKGKKKGKSAAGAVHPSESASVQKAIIKGRARMSDEFIKQSTKRRLSIGATSSSEPSSNTMDMEKITAMIAQQVNMQMMDLRDRREQRKHEAKMARCRMKRADVVDLTTTSSSSSSSSSSSTDGYGFEDETDFY